MKKNILIIILAIVIFYSGTAFHSIIEQNKINATAVDKESITQPFITKETWKQGVYRDEASGQKFYSDLFETTAYIYKDVVVFDVYAVKTLDHYKYGTYDNYHFSKNGEPEITITGNYNGDFTFFINADSSHSKEKSDYYIGNISSLGNLSEYMNEPILSYMISIAPDIDSANPNFKISFLGHDFDYLKWLNEYNSNPDKYSTSTIVNNGPIPNYDINKDGKVNIMDLYDLKHYLLNI